MPIVRFPSEQVFRCALVIEPRQPFIDWYDRVTGGPESYAEVSHDEGETLFLIPDAERPEDAHAYVDEHFDTFFTHILEMHCPNFGLWPRQRTAALFRAWFRARIHSLVLDVDPSPLKHG